MPNPADVESLTDIAQGLTTKMAEKRKDVVFREQRSDGEVYLGKKVEGLYVLENLLQAWSQNHSASLPQLLGVKVLQFSELPWSFVYKAKEDDLFLLAYVIREKIQAGDYYPFSSVYAASPHPLSCAVWTNHEDPFVPKLIGGCQWR
ncbi:hypothetical protein MP228_009703 [Amoeboaphelidium protococcarum]|nr:hypothetical protein MP228_009703 [Amoeboaphelidium protococcarum]